DVSLAGFLCGCCGASAQKRRQSGARDRAVWYAAPSALGGPPASAPSLRTQAGAGVVRVVAAKHQVLLRDRGRLFRRRTVGTLGRQQAKVVAPWPLAEKLATDLNTEQLADRRWNPIPKLAALLVI